MNITYTFNSKEFVASYGVRVQSATGLLDIPDRKDIQKYDFPDSNGYSPELSTAVYEERKISLKCYIKATTPQLLVENFYKICYDLKSQTAVKDLVVVITPSTGAAKTLTFSCYVDKVSKIEKRIRDGVNIGTFTIEFIEPEPTITSYE